MSRALPLLVLAVACSDAKLGSADRAPEVAILSPLDGGSFRAGVPFTLCAEISDEDELATLQFRVEGSADGVLWEGTGSPATCTSGNFALEVTLTGPAQSVAVSAIDTLDQVGTASVDLVPAQDAAPTCTIDSPTEGQVVRAGTPLPFRALVADPDDDPASLDVALVSDVDDVLWSGNVDSSGVFALDPVLASEGDHLLTLTVTDPAGRTDICGVRVTVEGCHDDDADGFLSCEDDCDDTDAAVNPDAVEVPDGVDNDCNDLRDDTTILYDDDGDGQSEVDGDCDDADPDRYSGHTERWYDGVDQDCDERDDDRDEDGFPFAEDCDDGDPARNPAADEIWYDGVDQDCDGNDDDQDADGWSLVDDCDDTDASVRPDAPESWYDGVDQDCDGRDDDQDSDGFVRVDDCDDTNASVRPDATELWYDGVDQDCDGRDDDQDDDGVERAGDCDDTDPERYPGHAEVWYDGVDQDCDGNDEDQDGDGTLVDDDCDDTDASVNPGATESWYDGVDQDCDGRDDDRDGDGFLVADDCVDTDASIRPDATEVWYDGIDQNCDGQDDDQDGDGVVRARDCDDTDARRYPGRTEVWYDGLDQDCDGNDSDRDGDGYALFSDCDDGNASVHPDAMESWYDGIDQDCDGNDTDQDEDGVAVASDCDDTDPTVYPGATETRNGADDDCDLSCDEGLILPGDLLVTEFLRDPYSTTDANGEWFEVKNVTGVDIALCSGWRIYDDGTDSHTLTSTVVVPAGDYAVFGRTSDRSVNGNVLLDYAYGTALSLGNTGDELNLAFDGTVIDRVTYVTSAWSAATASGVSSSLRAASTSAAANDSVSNWCKSTSVFYGTDKGTPGSPNDPC